ncbi:antibiotic biosynthesis monooxygenase [Puniceicoccaceae bacterium K14]|nr:antibiotic biosynthesis monooxygenase [Puniceicoccaceae bacterium K14]
MKLVRTLLMIFVLSGFASAEQIEKEATEVTVINPIEIPEGRLEEALGIWDKYAEYFRKQPGYLGTALHQSMDPSAKFVLINVARWKSAEAFMSALQSEELKAIGDGFPDEMPHYPSIYTIIRN